MSAGVVRGGDSGVRVGCRIGKINDHRAIHASTVPPLLDRELTDAERLGVIERVDEILQLKHRSADTGTHDDPLDEAVYILLSQQTRQGGNQRSFKELRCKWPTWADLRLAPIGEIVEVLTPGGLSPSRAQELVGLLHAVAAECAERGVDALTLDWLVDMTDEEAESYLVTLPGIGVESARRVIHNSLKRDGLVMDTHVRRILDRLGVVAGSGGKVNDASYDSAIPARFREQLHVNLVHHGRAYCKLTSPLCDTCPLISFCRQGQSRVAEIDTARRASTRRRKDGVRPVAVELFAGGGGMGVGFDRAGFDIAIAVELDRAAAQTYRLNHPGTVVLEADATAITGADLVRLAPRVARVCAIVAGPPCQGYSMAGRRKADDTKNVLYEAVIALAAELKPRFVVIENVPGIRKVEGRSFVETINDALADAGYSSREHLLRACDFGVPQLRRRMLFLAQRTDLGSSPQPPVQSHCPGKHCLLGCGDRPGQYCKKPPTPTVLDTLRTLPMLESGQSAEHLQLAGYPLVLNGSTMAHSKRVVAKIATIAAGEGPISYRRLHKDIARTIVAGHRALPVHPTLHRTLSVREAARIQGFDDSHVFCGSRSQQPLQVANAVPPQLAEAVARAIISSGLQDRVPTTSSP